MTIKTNRARFEPSVNSGFTIVELVIVIVVIAILAAITILAYNGITSRAIDATMRNDLQNAASLLAIDNNTNGGYPADANSANGGKGLPTSGDNQLTYSLQGNSYCLSITNPKAAAPLRLRSDGGTIDSGICGVVVSTLAGSGAPGFVDATGTAAQFRYPQLIQLDPSGNIFVADRLNNRIRKVTNTGSVTTFAGGNTGYTDGDISIALFKYPTGIARSPSGDWYIAESDWHRIRKIDTSGNVTTFAGSTSGTAGSVDGNGTSARFNEPEGMVVDPAGNIYVAGYFDNKIRKITPSGDVTTFAGSGTYGYADGAGTAAQFRYPRDVALDNSGNVYVTDTYNNMIRKITPSGVVTTLGGSGTAGYADGNGASAQFNIPRALAVDGAGYVYVTDAGNNRVRKISPSGDVTTIAGSGVSGYQDGPGSTAKFNTLSGIDIDGSGTIYVAEINNHTIRKITQ